MSEIGPGGDVSRAVRIMPWTVARRRAKGEPGR